MQSAVNDIADNAVLAPATVAVGSIVAFAVATSLLAARAGGAESLQKWHRWFNAVAVAAWLASAWLVSLRLIAAPSFAELAIRSALIFGFWITLLPLFRDLVFGLVIGFEGRLHLGSEIRIGDHQGRITRLGLRSVVIRGENGSEIIIPNARVSNMEVVRADPGSRDIICELEVNIPRAVDVEQVARKLVESVVLSPYAAPGRLPDVFVVPGEGDTLRLRARGYVFDRACEERFRGDVLARFARGGEKA